MMTATTTFPMMTVATTRDLHLNSPNKLKRITNHITSSLKLTTKKTSNLLHILDLRSLIIFTKRPRVFLLRCLHFRKKVVCHKTDEHETRYFNLG